MRIIPNLASDDLRAQEPLWVRSGSIPGHMSMPICLMDYMRGCEHYGPVLASQPGGASFAREPQGDTNLDNP